MFSYAGAPIPPRDQDFTISDRPNHHGVSVLHFFTVMMLVIALVMLPLEVHVPQFLSGLTIRHLSVLQC
jgi:hypothetical protein